MKSKTLFSVLSLITLSALTATAQAGDQGAMNPPQGTLISPMSYQLLGTTIENKSNGDKVGLVCLEMDNDGLCNGYRYVEISSLMNSKWKALGKQNFQLRKEIVINEEKDSYWLTKDMADTIDAAAKDGNGRNIVGAPGWSARNAKESYIGFATGYGMIVGVGEVTWVGAVAVDGVHAIVVYPFEALANAIRKGTNARNNKVLVKMGQSDEIGKNLELGTKRYYKIRDAIDGQL